MATQEQAKALKKAGFKVWARQVNPGAPVGKLKSPTMKWIRENLSSEKAGLVLRKIRDVPPKQSWNVRLPKRPFAEVNKRTVRKEIAKSINHRKQR